MQSGFTRTSPAHTTRSCANPTRSGVIHRSQFAVSLRLGSWTNRREFGEVRLIVEIGDGLGKKILLGSLGV